MFKVRFCVDDLVLNLLPFVELFLLFGFELRIGWMNFYIVIDYRSDKDIEEMKYITDSFN